MKPMDGAFIAAVCRVGEAMSAKGEDYETAGADLARYLLSESPLGPEERSMLADLVRGYLRRARGRPPKTASNQEVVQSVKKMRAKPVKILHHAWEAGKSERTLQRNKGKVTDREKAIAEAKKPRR